MKRPLLDFLALLAGAAAAGLLIWAGLATLPEPGTLLSGSVSSLQELAGFAAASAGLVLGVAVGLWWALGLLMAVASALLQKAGRTAAAAAAGTFAPAFMKRLAAALLGINLLAAALPAAHAAGTGPEAGYAAAAVESPAVGPAVNPVPVVGVRPPPPGEDAAATPHWQPRTPTDGSVLIRPGRAQLPHSGQVVVRPGDSLWGLAAEQLGPAATDADIAAHWPRWHELNRGVIGDRPELIRPGQLLSVPPAVR